MANTDQTEIIVEIWEKLQEYIPQNKREDAAVTFLETIINDDTLEFDKIELVESNNTLDKAYSLLEEEYGDDEIEIDEEL